MTNQEVLTNYVKQITSALKNAGVEEVVISPGSRSTPLAYAFSASKAFTIYRQVDERSAGFFALGLAKASRRPVVLLCTSGTAASNYYPAITEAHYARIPLIAMTADRPHELREVGAPQAIDQVDMYGKHVKWAVDFPLADANEAVDLFLLRHTQRGVSVAMTEPRGPVHFNIPFREPLLIDMDLTVSKMGMAEHIVNQGALDEQTKGMVEHLLRKAPSGIVIAGELPIDVGREAFWRFAGALNWPVLCDPLSNLRTFVPANYAHLCIDQYDALLKSEAFCEKAKVHTVLRVGAQPVSKPLTLFLKNYCPEQFIVVDENPVFRDSLNLTTHHIQAAPQAILQLFVAREKQLVTDEWTRANALFTDLIEKYAEDTGGEGAYAYAFFKQLPDEVDLISGSSMPIRDVDTFFGKTDRDITLFANRGTNGIDGVVSTALGIQAARQRPAYLLIGDLSFLHDVNGLIATRFMETDLTIVIMNNDGGGIFSYLPQANVATHFEDLFGTPTGLTFDHIAKMYDAQYDAIHSLASFKEALDAKKEKPLRIIEVFTDRAENVEAHRTLWQQMIKRLEENE